MTYTFEFIYLPELVENSNQEDFTLDNVDLLDTFDSLAVSFSENYPQQEDQFDWEHLQLRKEMRIDLEYWLLTFPPSQTEPQAKWGIVVHPEGEPYQYFTFERGSGDQYFLCGFQGDIHLNYGKFNEHEVTEEKFIQLALEKARTIPH